MEFPVLSEVSLISPQCHTGIIIIDIVIMLNWVFAAPFIQGVLCIELWDNLSGYVHPGIACLAS